MHKMNRWYGITTSYYGETQRVGLITNPNRNTIRKFRILEMVMLSPIKNYTPLSRNYTPLLSHHNHQHSRLLWPSKGTGVSLYQEASNSAVDSRRVSPDLIKFWYKSPGDGVRCHSLRLSPHESCATIFKCQLQAPGCLTCSSDWPTISQASPTHPPQIYSIF